MRELVTYKRAQYQAFVDEIQREGREITSIFEYQETDDVKALFSKPGVAVDITPFIELRLNEQLAPLYELFLLMMPPDVLFIADEEAAEKGRYLLRNTFSSFKNCEADMEDSQDGEVMETFIGILIPFIGTTLGSACVFFMKKSLSNMVQRSLAGFAAGVMVAASIWSLLIPAIEQSESMGRLSFLPAFIGF